MSKTSTGKIEETIPAFGTKAKDQAKKAPKLLPWGRNVLCRLVVGQAETLWTPSDRYPIKAIKIKGGIPVPVVEILARGGWVNKTDLPIGAYALVDPMNITLLNPKDVEGKENLCIVREKSFIALVDPKALKWGKE